jgi:hypothetical protein
MTTETQEETMSVVTGKPDLRRVIGVLSELDKRMVFYGVTKGWTGFGVIRFVGSCECGHEREDHDWGESGEMLGEGQHRRCDCREYRDARPKPRRPGRA